MTRILALALSLSLSSLFGVDTSKELGIPSLSTPSQEIQFDAEIFQQNQLIKKRMSENYKQARKAKSMPKPAGSPIYISNQKSDKTLLKETPDKKILQDKVHLEKRKNAKQKLESIKAHLNPKNFFGDFNSRSAHKKEPAKVDYLTRRDDHILSGTWMMAPEAGALMVGPNPFDGSWWSNSEEDVNTRACYFDDRYVFDEDGFHNDLDDETWLEWWQGADPEGCGFPVYPHDGSNNPAGYTFDEVESTLTLHGLGAYIGLPKAANGFELTSPDQAPESVTYQASFSNDGQIMYLVIEVGDGVFWTFKLISTEDEEDNFTYLGEFEGHEYWLSNYQDTWNNAHDTLSQYEEAHLVTISSQEEHQFVLDNSGGNILIGFTDEADEGNWEWVTGEEVTYTNWGYYEPNGGDGENYCEIMGDGTWSDIPEDMEQVFVVEVIPDSTGGDPGWLIAYVFDWDGYPIEDAYVSAWNDEFYFYKWGKKRGYD
mgnify:FL=1